MDKAICNFYEKKLLAGSKNETKHVHDHFKSCPKWTTRDIRQQILVKEYVKADEGACVSSCHFN